MKNTYDRTIIIGRLSTEPVMRYDKEVCTFTLSNSSFDNGTEITLFHKIAAFGKQAFVCNEHLHQGDLCCIEGVIRGRDLSKPDSKMTIVAQRVTFLSRRREAVPETTEAEA